MRTEVDKPYRRRPSVGLALNAAAVGSAAVGVTALTAFALQAAWMIVGGPPTPNGLLLAVGGGALAVAWLAVDLGTRLSIPEPRSSLAVWGAAVVSTLIAAIAFAPDARSLSSLGRLQIPLVVAGLGSAASASWWVPRLVGRTPSTPPNREARLAALFRQSTEFVRREQPVVVLLLVSFLARFLLADWSSYWYDELLSVRVYGGSHATAIDAIRVLGERSVHPPLYQFILFNWMTLFGDSELATRTLSNLYITIATLFMYLIMRDRFNRRFAILTGIAFVCLNLTMYYGLESRSYAQTILLSVLSTYLALRLIQRQEHRGESSGPARGLMAALIAANLALLMTHYYNILFVGAQAVVMAFYQVRRRYRGQILRPLGAVAAMYGASVALFLALWGRFLFGRYSTLTAGYQVGEDGVVGPARLLYGSVISPNLRAGPIILVAIGLAVAAVVARALRDISRRAPTDPSSWGIVALAAWLVLPIVFTYLAFTLLGVQRYSVRYFVFSVAPVAALLVVAVDRLTTAAIRGVSRIRAVAMPTVWSTFAVGLAIALFLVPGAHSAATTQKGNWREITTAVVNIQRADPDSSYIVFETAHRRSPMSDYYFERLRTSMRPYATVTRNEESRGTYQLFTEHSGVIAEHDYLVLMFLHMRTVHYPTLLAELDLRYETHLKHLDRQGRGFIIYRTRSEMP